MWTRQLLKQNGKIAFQRNYWTCVLVCLVTSFLAGGIVGGVPSGTSDKTMQEVPNDMTLSQLLQQIDPLYLKIFLLASVMAIMIALCYSILVANVVTVGSSRYFLENREHKTEVSQLFYAFREGRYLSTVWVMFLKALYLFGWYLLFFVPGIVKSYSYMMVPYILAENPDMDRKRVFELSNRMMMGHKMEAFELELSFIGWFFLAALINMVTGCGGILSIAYINPYFHATMAEFYSAVKAEAKAKGLFSPEELPGVMPQVESAMF